MAQIRFIKKNADRIVEDCFKELQTQLDSSNLPAYVTIKTDGDREVINLSYTGSTESIIDKVLDSGIDVSIGSRSGRIVKIEGVDILQHIDDVLNVETKTERARNNLSGGVELIKGME